MKTEGPVGNSNQNTRCVLSKHFQSPDQSGQWAAGVFIKTPRRVVLVSEDLGKMPILKKISGGRKRPVDQTALDTAIREGHEETGLRLSPHEVRFVQSYDCGNHTYHLFTADIADERLAECYTTAKNGEEVHLLEHEKLRALEDEILGHHLRRLIENQLWPH